ncbi:hypothetical protein [Desulfovibrio sp. X2]|uniref:hypothetical protein n=1 Tax=Desulfovibrio sp. X2 TaxID=941449 RepID=UPI0012690AB6|nr:hypothetical protein [Desulfovibrio sp. X2]
MNFLSTFSASVIAAVVAAFIVSYLNSRLMLRITEKQIESQERISGQRVELDRESAFAEDDRLDRFFIAKKIEKAHIILSSLSSFHSQTSWYIHSESKLDSSDWDKKWLNELNKYNDLRMIIGLYFNNLDEICNALIGKANCFWMAQRQYMISENQNNEASKKHYSNEVVKLSIEIGRQVAILQNGLTAHTQKLGLPCHCD